VDSRDAAVVRRLDLLMRQVQRLERTNRVTMETLALFVRFFLTVTPPLPPDAMAAAQASRKQRSKGLLRLWASDCRRGGAFWTRAPKMSSPRLAGQITGSEEFLRIHPLYHPNLTL
jgi:hypothetical protein